MPARFVANASLALLIFLGTAIIQARLMDVTLLVSIVAGLKAAGIYLVFIAAAWWVAGRVAGE